MQSVTAHGEKVALKEIVCIDPLPTVPPLGPFGAGVSFMASLH